MTRYQKPVRPNPKKDRSARRKRNANFWKTGGRLNIPDMSSCKECIKAEKEARKKLQKEKPAPAGQVYMKNPYIRCEDCKKSK